MNKKLQPTVLALALAASFGAQAATVYKIENIDEFYKVNGTIQNSRSGFGVTLNNSGDILGGASGTFAPLLSEDDQNTINNNRVDVSLTQLNAQASNSSTNPLRVVKLIPQSNNSIFKFDTNELPEFIKVFDESITRDGREVSTIDSFAFDVSDTGVIVGTTSSAAYAIDDPDQSDDNADKDDPFYVYDYSQRALVIDNGVVKTFAPEFSIYGGQSGLTSINNNGLVVGYASTGLEYSSKTNIDSNCLDTYKETVPLQVCARGFSDGSKNNSAVRYYLEAYSWEYSNGELSNPKPLGILTTPINDTDTDSYNSIALGVNDKGIAVGRSKTFRDNDKKYSNRLDVAVVFKDEKVVDLMDHSETDWRYSSANAINNNDLVVGFMEKNISGFIRKKFFIYDANSENTTLTFPNDFSSSESDFASNAKGINDKNQVVGSIEVDSQKVDFGRRTHGFIYNHNDKSFSDLNDLLTCESKGYVQVGSDWKKYQVEATGGNEQKISYDADITVVDAAQIDEDGNIIATALVTLPRVKTRWVDDKGNEVPSTTEGAVEELVVDANGEPVFDTNSQGEPITEQIPRAVILKPTEGEACSVVEEDSADYKQERQGAGFGIGALLMATAGLFIRRFRR
ncbi:DUF3466 family protein [Psychrobium sp. MM17-31]|uniref:DUF3466 family protein n=1 Tax=Psychrobium sp. MM17-31 TaxID=2917758 RepID=UPI001EF71D41|nr:DUF3466 family protein [Psychrobium sp. MM17-31]MCG7529775.1 DUF3466 family protein [Psychrobium sp. MM17-31]